MPCWYLLHKKGGVDGLKEGECFLSTICTTTIKVDEMKVLRYTAHNNIGKIPFVYA